jgi:hypothetical protein
MFCRMPPAYVFGLPSSRVPQNLINTAEQQYHVYRTRTRIRTRKLAPRTVSQMFFPKRLRQNKSAGEVSQTTLLLLKLLGTSCRLDSRTVWFMFEMDALQIVIVFTGSVVRSVLNYSQSSLNPAYRHQRWRISSLILNTIVLSYHESFEHTSAIGCEP